MTDLKATSVIVAVLAIFLLCYLSWCFSGCVSIKHKGSEYLRVGPQALDNVRVVLPDGTVLFFDEQDSDGYTPVLLELIKRIPEVPK